MPHANTATANTTNSFPSRFASARFFAARRNLSHPPLCPSCCLAWPCSCCCRVAVARHVALVAVAIVAVALSVRPVKVERLLRLLWLFLALVVGVCKHAPERLLLLFRHLAPPLHLALALRLFLLCAALRLPALGATLGALAACVGGARRAAPLAASTLCPRALPAPAAAAAALGLLAVRALAPPELRRLREQWRHASRGRLSGWRRSWAHLPTTSAVAVRGGVCATRVCAIRVCA
eukprot:8532-Prymnesium_polylepis.1